MSNKNFQAASRKELLSSALRDKALILQRASYKIINDSHFNPDSHTVLVSDQMKKARNDGALSLDLSLELSRWEGLLSYKEAKLGKADEYWQAGLKSYWKTSGKTPRDTEAAARLRLTQLLFWKSQFDKLNLKSNAQKKLEIYQKLENGYAEVINMKSPSVALESLWETAKLFDSFSKELLSLPQTQAQGQEMKKNAQNLLVQIAKSSLEWKVFSPVVTAALQKLKNNPQEANSSDVLDNFPWPKLPRWMALSKEQSDWSEWDWSEAKLEKLLKNKSESRSSLQRAALVLLIKQNSLKSKILSDWAEILTQPSAIQMRIQAMLSDGNLRLAELYLEQYEDIFGKDNFQNYFQAQLDWLKGDYTSAYRQWSSTKNNKDFYSYYTAAAWTASLEHLAQGKVTEGTSEDIMSELKKLTTEPWQKLYAFSLCAGDYLDCKVDKKDLTLLTTNYPKYMSDDVSKVQVETLSAYLEKISTTMEAAQSRSETSELLSAYYNLGKYSTNHVAHYNKLRKEIENASDKLSNAGRNLASTPGERQ
jgi:hypothetical protein